MTEKRWKIIDEEFISYTGGNAIIISNGDFKFAIWETKEDTQKVCNKLNELHDENHKIKSILLKKVEELYDDYDRSARAGMPTGGIIGELISFKEICKIMGWIE